MYEGLIVPADHDAAAEEGALRPLAWTELVAQLAAAHELRHVLARDAMKAAGNFARFAHREEAGEGKRSVNPDDLGHGKAVGGMVAAAADGAVTGDRETR